MFHECITACITFACFVTVIVCQDIADKLYSVKLSAIFPNRLGLELLNGSMYNGEVSGKSNK